MMALGTEGEKFLVFVNEYAITLATNLPGGKERG